MGILFKLFEHFIHYNIIVKQNTKMAPLSGISSRGPRSPKIMDGSGHDLYCKPAHPRVGPSHLGGVTGNYRLVRGTEN